MNKFSLHKWGWGLTLFWFAEALLYGQEYRTREEAPDSWYIQGEYFGHFKDDGARVGAQVRAWGKNFGVHFTIGGLPGPESWPMGGWDGKWRELVTNRKLSFKNGSMEIKGAGVSAALTIPGNVRTADNEKKVISGTIQGRSFTMHRVERTSPTLGLKPVQGAEVLFDGTKKSFETNWKKLSGGYDESRKAIYRGVASKANYQDCYLHIELFSSYMPFDDDQGRSNSGIYMQRRYEAQIMDSFGEKGLQGNKKGGLYASVPPLINATFPPLVTWETYDIFFEAARDFKGGVPQVKARFLVYLNGVKTVDGIMPGPGTGGAAEGPTAGSIFLQDHGGDPIWFRNIWVVTDKSLYPDTATFGKCEDGTPIWVNGGCPVSLKAVENSEYGIKITPMYVHIGVKGGHSLEIRDVSGSIVYALSGFDARQYAIPDFGTSGVYFVKVSTSSKTFRKRILIF